MYLVMALRTEYAPPPPTPNRVTISLSVKPVWAYQTGHSQLTKKGLCFGALWPSAGPLAQAKIWGYFWYFTPKIFFIEANFQVRIRNKNDAIRRVEGILAICEFFFAWPGGDAIWRKASKIMARTRLWKEKKFTTSNLQPRLAPQE